MNTARVQVDERQNEGREREGRQTQWSWIGELSGGWSIQTRLEGASEGRQSHFWIIRSGMRKWIASVVIWGSLLGDRVASRVVQRVGASLLVVEIGGLVTIGLYDAINFLLLIIFTV